MDTRLLFKPGRIGSLAIPNRIVMPPMVLNYADANGRATDKYVAHIERIARGGVGAIVLEASYVTGNGRGFANQLGLHHDDIVPALRRVMDAAHSHGAVIGIQLFHAGRQTRSAVSGAQPVAPSAIPCPLMNEVPAELDESEIARLVTAFGDAARRAVDAGCDFVEIHGAHGYLVMQFLSPASNRRTDRYGGSFENRVRFLDEIIEAVRHGIGDRNAPVTVRISADEMVPGGLTIEDTSRLAMHLESRGIDALHVSAGSYGSYARGYMIPPMAREDAPLVEFARRIKNTVSIPVIAVGKLRDPAVAAGVLERGDADFVAIGRGLLADPDWPNKLRENRHDELNLCVTCNQACIGRLFAQQDVRCTINPETGRAPMFDAPPVASSLELLVIGAGPAGMTAARTAALRGHRVTVLERASQPGGQLAAAGAAPHRQNWWKFRDWLVRELERLNVPVHMGVEATAASLDEYSPDAIIIATGSSPNHPEFPSAGPTQVVTAIDILEERVQATGPVVVIGGGCSGAQTAEFLAHGGHDVTLVEAEPEIALDMPPDERALMLARLDDKCVRVHTQTRLDTIDAGEAVITSASGRFSLPIGTAVLSLGATSDNDLVAMCEKRDVPVAVVGDAVSPRKVTEATAEGALAILHIENEVVERAGMPEPAAKTVQSSAPGA